MKAKTLTLASALILAAGTLALADEGQGWGHGGDGRVVLVRCESLQSRMENVSHDISRLDHQIFSVRMRRDHERSVLQSRQSEMDQAIARVHSAENAISTLHYEFNNGPELIITLQQNNVSLDESIPALEQQARVLEQEYHAISGNFFKRLKKHAAKNRWEDKLEEISRVHNQISSNEARIIHINAVMDHFAAMLAQAEHNLRSAEYDLSSEQAITPTIDTLEMRAQNLSMQLHSLERDKSRDEFELRELQTKLSQCLQGR